MQAVLRLSLVCSAFQEAVYASSVWHNLCLELPSSYTIGDELDFKKHSEDRTVSARIISQARSGGQALDIVTRYWESI